jgi:hypothetical protein
VNADWAEWAIFMAGPFAKRLRATAKVECCLVGVEHGTGFVIKRNDNVGLVHF